MPILYLLRVHLKYKCFKNFCSISNDHVGSVEWFTEHLMPFWKTHLAEGSYYLRETFRLANSAAAGHQHPALPPPSSVIAETCQPVEEITGMLSECQSINAYCLVFVGWNTSRG